MTIDQNLLLNMLTEREEMYFEVLFFKKKIEILEALVADLLRNLWNTDKDISQPSKVDPWISTL